MILTVAMGKGGTAKSTTAAAIANLARMNGKKVLVLDIDPQGNCTAALGGDNGGTGMYDLLTRKSKPAKLIQRTPQADLIPAGEELANAIAAIQNKPGRDNILKAALAPVVGLYDLILIDTPPDINTLLINALAASDTVLLPMQATLFCFMGLQQMGETIAQVREYCNPNLGITGIVLTKHNPRSALARDIVPEIQQQAQAMGTKVFNTHIRQAASVEQAQIMRQSLFEYAPRSTAAADYMALYAEMNLKG